MHSLAPCLAPTHVLDDAPTQLVVGVYVIVTELGWAGALGIATMAAAAPVSNRLSSRLSVGCHSSAATVTTEHRR